MKTISTTWQLFAIGIVAIASGCERASSTRPAAPSTAEIRFAVGLQSPQISVLGLPADVMATFREITLEEGDWQRILSLQVAANEESPAGLHSSQEMPSMLGDYSLLDASLAFSPRFPLRPGLQYKAVFDPEPLAAILNDAAAESAGQSPDSDLIRAARFVAAADRLPRERTNFTFSLPPLPPSPPTNVTAIYPSRDVLPENQLKFYIHFSAPMSRGEAYERVRLEKASGEVVPIPFLELSEELWDADTQRFTIFFEPGRVKRGVMLRDEIGPALVAGEEYAFVVDGAWRDAIGKPLGPDFAKKFRTSPQDETQPDPHQWKLSAPPAGSREPLVVEFNEPLDHAMLQRVIRVVSAAGGEKAGEINVDRDETRWRFTPDEAWGAEQHELVIAGVLEDLAGNSVGRKFEVRLENRDQEVLKEVRVPFQMDGRSGPKN